MQEPRVVYACNHNIIESFEELYDKQLSYTGHIPSADEFESAAEHEEWKRLHTGRDVLFGPEDLAKLNKSGTVSANEVTILDINPVTEYQQSIGMISYVTNGYGYKEGVDFEISTAFKSTGQYLYLDWLSGGMHPEYYIAKLQYTRSLNETYAAESCPRCCGDGWYVGLFEIANTNASIVKDENKLIQAFFKFIHTRKLDSGYGSTISKLPGKYTTADEQELYSMISDEIAQFEKYYKNKISALMLNGYAASEEEQLKGQSLVDMEIDDETHVVEVQVRFFTMANSQLDVNLILPKDEDA